MTLKLITGSLLALLTLAVSAQDINEKAIRSALATAIPGLMIERVVPTPVPGVAEVVSQNEQSLYISYDGTHFFVGDLYAIEGGGLKNLTEAKRESERAALIKAIPESDMIVFSPKDPKATISVFTDVDCGYCRKLHAEIAEMNRLGIRVNYLAFPRAPAGSETYNTMVSVWCSKDRAQALTDAKQGKSVPTATCDNPVASQKALGERIGVNGTPAIVLEGGKLVPGYVPAQKLAAGLGIL